MFSCLSIVSASSLMLISSFFKANLIFGSKSAFFSAINIVGPLCGMSGSLAFSGAVFALASIARIAMLAKFSLASSILSYHIPTFFASASWAHPSFLFRCLVPLACIILFVVHPVGGQVSFYACYWLIPLAIYCMPSAGVFLTALASTFVAHAVGSVLWLYAVPLDASIFAALMPIVIVERLLYATGMTLVCMLLDFLKKIIMLAYNSCQSMGLLIYAK